jgi:hypothetical protein
MVLKQCRTRGFSYEVHTFHSVFTHLDRLCGLVVRVLDCRSGSPGSIPGNTMKKKVVGLERGPLSLVSTTEELLGRKSSGSCLETENTAVGICHADHVAPSIPQKLAITSPTSGGRSVGIDLSRNQTMEFSFSLFHTFDFHAVKHD